MLFDRPAATDLIVLKEPKPLSTFRAICNVYLPKAVPQTKAVAANFKGFSRENNAVFLQIWTWCRAEFTYRKDRDEYEEIRLPRRSWADRQKGIDCEDFVIMIGGILHHLNVDFSVRMTDYGDGWQHIYIATQSGCIIDPVNTKFNDEPAYKRKLDHSFKPKAKGTLSGISAISKPFKPITAMQTAQQKLVKRLSKKADKMVEEAGTHKVVIEVNNLNRKDAMKILWAREKGQKEIASGTVDGLKRKPKKKATAKKKPAAKKKATTTKKKATAKKRTSKK